MAEAKNKFSEVVTRALTEGPQRVHRRGQTVVILAEDEYDRLSGKQDKPDFIEYLLSAPSFEGVDLERDQSLMRDVEF
ncbi:MAG TPA: type II toxin-antitoxin system prevent-host-death family antitoxin [Thermomicrobiales bacterium]|nr:type II toxin-antitoxin system prevent-host-death family antitoxin [Thermomicrobiales bacterium]